MPSSPDLHKFTDDLKLRPGPGVNSPPRSIRAKDLDKNFKKVTVAAQSVVGAGLLADYQVQYKKDGVELAFEAGEFYVCEDGKAVKYRLLGQKAPL